MDTTTVSPSNGEDQEDETTEGTSATAGKDVGKDQTPIELYTVIEVQAMLRLTKRGTYEWIRQNVRPIGGLVRLGKRILIHKWALNAALKQKTWDLTPSEKQRKALSRHRYILPKRKSTKTTPE